MISSCAYLAALRVALDQLPVPRLPLRAPDRRLALDLHHRGIPFPILRAALRLAVLRRLQRDPALAPLSPIRSLAYFLPVLDELLATTPDPVWLAHLDARFVSLTACSAPPADPNPSAPVQIPAVSDER